MDYDELKKVAFSSIKEDDPYKASKQLQIKHWCAAFLDMLHRLDEEELLFFLDILSDEECWEKTDTIHGIKLNRKIVAKKMVAPQNRKGMSNPLHDSDRYDIACRCCLEEDINTLFEQFKQECTADSLEQFVKRMSGGDWHKDPMAEYWSHVVGGCTSGLKLEGQHLYVFGLNQAMSLCRKLVEPVEFFWNKIKSLPENELSTQEKDEAFMNTAVRAAGNECNGYPDVFEFCLGQISHDRYPELLKRDLEKNGYYGSLYKLQDSRSFDQFQRLFDCLRPGDVPKRKYCTLLRCMEVGDCSGQYVNAGAKLLVHMLMKDGFDDHLTSALNGEMISNSVFQGELFLPLVEKGCIDSAWAILNIANPIQVKEFMSSEKADQICSILKERGDKDSLNKFLSYSKSANRSSNKEANLTEVKLSKIHDQLHK